MPVRSIETRKSSAGERARKSGERECSLSSRAGVSSAARARPSQHEHQTRGDLKQPARPETGRAERDEFSSGELSFSK
jgi:hypothetical protein